MDPGNLPGLSPSESNKLCPDIDGASWRKCEMDVLLHVFGEGGGSSRERGRLLRWAAHGQCPYHKVWVQGGSSDNPLSHHGTLPVLKAFLIHPEGILSLTCFTERETGAEGLVFLPIAQLGSELGCVYLLLLPGPCYFSAPQISCGYNESSHPHRVLIMIAWTQVQ